MEYIPKNAVLVPEDAERVFEGVIYDVYQWPQELFDGSIATFEMLKRPHSSFIIPIVEDKIVVLEDTQPHAGTRISLPGGRLDVEGKNPYQGAQRELVEETGMEFEKLTLVDCIQPHVKIEWFVYLFVASGKVKKVPVKHDPGEKIKAKLMDFEEVKRQSTQRNDLAPTVFRNVNSIEELLALKEYFDQ